MPAVIRRRVLGANRVSTNPLALAVAVSGNKCRPGPSTTKAVRELSISSGSGIHRFGDDVRGTWSDSGGTGTPQRRRTPPPPASSSRTVPSAPYRLDRGTPPEGQAEHL
ncbi:hypothetical protein [Streptomyces sp. YIM 121038]|uniref:hypothetical protein n=1 Tax=Streptomyces sp. YIM 121038 TaxID=2136401 RepID=UPI001BB14128|nr:hypothetical protein [Streptomyces sp. YIM 121038]